MRDTKTREIMGEWKFIKAGEREKIRNKCEKYWKKDETWYSSDESKNYYLLDNLILHLYFSF